MILENCTLKYVSENPLELDQVLKFHVQIPDPLFPEQQILPQLSNIAASLAFPVMKSVIGGVSLRELRTAVQPSH